MRRSLVLALAFAAVLPVRTQSQQPVGRTLTIPDYDNWKSIRGSSISNDGKWIAYAVVPQVGEGDLIIHAVQGGKEYKQHLGYIAPKPYPAGISAGGGSFTFTPDSKAVLFSVAPPRDSVEQAFEKKVPEDKRPKARNYMLDLATGAVKPFLSAEVKSYTLSEGKKRILLAYQLEVPKPKADSSKAAPDTGKKSEPAKPESSKVAAADSGKKKKRTPSEDGEPLILRDWTTQDSVRIEHVTSTMYLDSGTILIYTASSKDDQADGIFMKRLDGSLNAAPTAIITGPGHYKSISVDKANSQIAFLTDRDEFTKDKPRFRIYYGKLDGTPAKVVLADTTVGPNMRLADAGVTFNKSGNFFSFQIEPPPEDSISPEIAKDGAKFDLWHWKDPIIQTMQAKSKDFYEHPKYEALYFPQSGKWVKVSNDSARSVSFSEDGRIGVAATSVPYLISGMWGEAKTDFYLVDPDNGQWKLIKKGLLPIGGDVPGPGGAAGHPDLSPGAKYVLFFENKQWWSYNVATGKTVNITAKIPGGIRWDNEEDDHPAPAGPHGIVGWTKDDDRVLIADRFDVWVVDPNGVAPAKNLTNGIGRKKHINFRITQLGKPRDPNSPYTDITDTLKFSARNVDNMDNGYWVREPNGTMKPILMVSKAFTVIGKAKDAEQWLVSEATFSEFPDLWTGPSLTNLEKISDAFPERHQWRLGTAELVRYKNREGVPLKGILYKPDGFDPKKKYPMVVGIYEKLSDHLYGFPTPAINYGAEAAPLPYVSKGYLFLQPDIVYRDGHPGMSSVSCVTAAVQSLIDSGFVDPKRIALTGHSWGGYEDAFIATKTNMFAAIVSGAPVSNMSSAYGGIRWGAGMNRSMQYEHTQSRIGFPPWVRPDLYLENSTLFHVQNIHTPMMIMHNDQDGAVPWYQGIELYIAMRRSGKEAYMFNYNGEDHGLGKLIDRLDWDVRMQEFIDHFLADAPAPDWMVNGIPVNRKIRAQVPQVVKLLTPPKSTTATTTPKEAAAGQKGTNGGGK